MIKTNTIKKRDYSVTYEYIPLFATEDQIKQAKEFAPAYAAKRLKIYKDKRNQSDLQNIINQCYPGKIMEFMAYNHIKNILPDATIIPPSCEIYDNPTFDDDLVIIQDNKKVKIHVKSHDIARIWKERPLSWAFQKEDKLFKYKKNDILVMGIYINEKEGHLLTKNYVHKYKDFLGPAKNPSLTTKEFVYYNEQEPIFKLK